MRDHDNPVRDPGPRSVSSTVLHDPPGKVPLMQDLCEQVIQELQGKTPFIEITTNDKIMSSIRILGSMDPEEDWGKGKRTESRHFLFVISPQDGKRKYNSADKKVVVELISRDKPNLKYFHKYSGPIQKCLVRIKKWIKDNEAQASSN